MSKTKLQEMSITERHNRMREMSVEEWKQEIRDRLTFVEGEDDPARTKAERKRWLIFGGTRERNNSVRAFEAMKRSGEIKTVGTHGGKNSRWALQTECDRVAAVYRERKVKREEQRDEAMMARLLEIAGTDGIETFEAQGRESLDFHDIHIHSLRDMMIAAYRAGQEAK